MDIPDVSNLTAKAKDLTSSGIGGDLVGKATDFAQEKLSEVKKIADEKGFGGTLDSVINKVEGKTGVDIDGDGDAGK